jgi:predicted HD superfamily hydrolase involved in NAD metabolism
LTTKLVRKQSKALKREALIKKLRTLLDRERFAHSLRVEKVALALGKRWKVREELISPAALLHDCGRRYPRKELLRQAIKLGLEIDPIRKFEPKLFHAEIGAAIARKEFGINSQPVLDAITNHTVGRAGMSKLEKIIYLADHIEEDRGFKGVKEMRKLAFKDLRAAIVASASNMIEYLLQGGLPVFTGTVETRNYYLLDRNRK